MEDDGLRQAGQQRARTDHLVVGVSGNDDGGYR
jgi:hypothetical protein